MMGGKQVNRAYLSRFNFGGEQNKKVSMPGEKPFAPKE
jgi:hypothetical protein